LSTLIPYADLCCARAKVQILVSPSTPKLLPGSEIVVHGFFSLLRRLSRFLCTPRFTEPEQSLFPSGVGLSSLLSRIGPVNRSSMGPLNLLCSGNSRNRVS